MVSEATREVAGDSGAAAEGWSLPPPGFVAQGDGNPTPAGGSGGSADQQQQQQQQVADSGGGGTTNANNADSVAPVGPAGRSTRSSSFSNLAAALGTGLAESMEYSTRGSLELQKKAADANMLSEAFLKDAGAGSAGAGNNADQDLSYARMMRHAGSRMMGSSPGQTAFSPSPGLSAAGAESLLASLNLRGNAAPIGPGGGGSGGGSAAGPALGGGLGSGLAGMTNAHRSSGAINSNPASNLLGSNSAHNLAGYSSSSGGNQPGLDNFQNSIFQNLGNAAAAGGGNASNANSASDAAAMKSLTRAFSNDSVDDHFASSLLGGGQNQQQQHGVRRDQSRLATTKDLGVVVMEPSDVAQANKTSSSGVGELGTYGGFLNGNSPPFRVDGRQIELERGMQSLWSSTDNGSNVNTNAPPTATPSAALDQNAATRLGSGSPAGGVAATAGNANTSRSSEDELRQFTWDSRHHESSRTLAIFRAFSFSPTDMRMICEQYGMIETFRPDFSEKGIYFVGYFDMRSAQTAARDLQPHLQHQQQQPNAPGTVPGVEVRYCVPLNSSSQFDESLVVLTDIPSDIEINRLLHMLSSYGKVRSLKSHGGMYGSSSYVVEYHDVQDSKRAVLELESSQPWGPNVMVEYGPRNPSDRKRGRELLALIGRWRREGSPQMRSDRLMYGGVNADNGPHMNGPRYGDSNGPHDRSYSPNSMYGAGRGRDQQQQHRYNHRGGYNNDGGGGNSNYMGSQDGQYGYADGMDRNAGGPSSRYGGGGGGSNNHYNQNYHPTHNQGRGQHYGRGGGGGHYGNDRHQPHHHNQPHMSSSNYNQQHQYGGSAMHGNQDRYYGVSGDVSGGGNHYHGRNGHSNSPLYNDSHHSGGGGSSRGGYNREQGYYSDDRSIGGQSQNSHKYSLPDSRSVGGNSIGMSTLAASATDEKDKRNLTLDLELVESGQDTRTSLMVRNIPNKYTQKMLLTEFNENGHGPGVIDFFYLPIDFKNRCNRGYAFINFVDYRDILHFHQSYFGKHWRTFNSDKICDITYARIQGKAAMLKRFENSALMEKDEEYKPLVFVSHGADKGVRIPFPNPQSSSSNNNNSSSGGGGNRHYDNNNKHHSSSNSYNSNKQHSSSKHGNNSNNNHRNHHGKS
mmetsp:Transcript_5328/g.15636  ORF Transcript_5328/g.15636 Transcript_5328/m.15636 type:complete len:1133 (-) Transcript_5328:124-3522(-)|eukprot:CAMPEP_0119561088 /NCGR_PEP_ID=MMETSP1352-20130426/16639_1 /TAXON_ID=265584 /ORGANISM="Stauroneis constricta, Strain CCMP1120" /LENGTH=1132 /DNA_ID=CAMNT_0007609207 /DNA_START=296 /DNA_END=3694 /DNA_ORIENTATION=+